MKNAEEQGLQASVSTAFWCSLKHSLVERNPTNMLSISSSAIKTESFFKTFSKCSASNPPVISKNLILYQYSSALLLVFMILCEEDVFLFFGQSSRVFS